jgi:hypothetical protein
LAKYNYNDKVKKDARGGAYSTNGENEELVQVIDGKAGKETTMKTKREVDG